MACEPSHVLRSVLQGRSETAKIALAPGDLGPNLRVHEVRHGNRRQNPNDGHDNQ